MPETTPSLTTCLIAGAVAGTSVDVILFPLDTIKTRLQSPQGFIVSGGLNGIYTGISSTLLGSAPSAALFFLTYESMKQAIAMVAPSKADSSLSHVVSASLAEVSACTIRVPVEVLKQRMQVFHYQSGLLAATKSLYASEGILGFYRGFQATLQREIPFACIQFPLYELLKQKWRRKLISKSNTTTSPSSSPSSSSSSPVNNKGDNQEILDPWKAAICGSIAGGITAALTAPLDVIKTRTILSKKDDLRHYRSTWQSLRTLWLEGGFKMLFAGVGPRVLWISLGGYIFFGAYEKAKRILSQAQQHRRL